LDDLANACNGYGDAKVLDGVWTAVGPTDAAGRSASSSRTERVPPPERKEAKARERRPSLPSSVSTPPGSLIDIAERMAGLQGSTPLDIQVITLFMRMRHAMNDSYDTRRIENQ
jgi:hypothetical protein